MATYLKINPGDAAYRLPPDADENEVMAEIDQAWAEHRLAHVKYVASDQVDPMPLSIDPSRFDSWFVLYAPDPDESSAK